MGATTRDYLEIVAPYLPRALVSERSLATMRQIAQALPPSSNLIFESRLDSPAADVDFLVAIIASDGSRGAWAGKNALARAPALDYEGPVWERIHRFIADWDGQAPGFECVNDNWLEFDLDEQTRGVPVPSFFFGFDHRRGTNHPDFALTGLEQIRLQPLTSGARARLGACHEALPPKTQIFQVGTMFSRPTDAVRLCIKHIDPRHIPDYLGRIGWPGSADEAQRFVAQFAPFADEIGLDWDVAETVSPTVGLECTIRTPGAPGRTKAQAFVAHLVDNGWCTPEKAAAIFQWLGYCTEATDRDRWPAHLLKASASMPEGVMSAFGRTFNHIKVNYTPGEPYRAKLYLAARHYWVRRGEGRA
jgi:hypothetical protein